MSDNGDSYGRILRSSSIVGGAQAANYLIGMLRVKVVAALLGPTGVGLVGLYTSAISLVSVVSGLGVGSSAVREVARAFSNNDTEEARRTVTILRWTCLATGLLGWALMILLSDRISEYLTGSDTLARSIDLLGSVVLLGAVSSGQLALLQGLRRIGDLARASVLGSVAGTVSTVLIYFVWGEAGIVPAIIAVALVSLACSWWFARRTGIVLVPVNGGEIWAGFRRLAGLGVAMMWGALLVSGLDFLTRSTIVRAYGVDAAGIYQSAWAISGIFANFVLSAMGADFYPRLTAAIDDKPRAVREVNQQTEIGLLLALPGLLAMLAFAPLAIQILYTPKFLPAADLLPWMALGVFGQVVSWPMGFIQLAKGASRWFAATETIFAILQGLLMVWLVGEFGILGAAYAFAATYAIYIPAMLWVSNILIGFSWSPESRTLIFAAAILAAAGFASRFLPSEVMRLTAGAAVTLAGSVFCARGLARRLGQSNRLVGWILTAPGGRLLLAGTMP